MCFLSLWLWSPSNLNLRRFTIHISWLARRDTLVCFGQNQTILTKWTLKVNIYLYISMALLNAHLKTTFALHRYWNSSKRQLLIGQKPGEWLPSQNTNWQGHSWGSPVCQKCNFRSSHEPYGFITSGYYQGVNSIGSTLYRVSIHVLWCYLLLLENSDIWFECTTRIVLV